MPVGDIGRRHNGREVTLLKKKCKKRRDELIKNNESDVEAHEYITGRLPHFPEGFLFFAPRHLMNEGEGGGIGVRG